MAINQGIQVKLVDVDKIKKEFDGLLKSLQDKADATPIQINIDDLTRRLKEVEDKVAHSMDNVTKLTKKSVNNAITGVNYKDFKSKIDEVVKGLNASGNQVSDVFTTIDAKTKAITGATVKYTDSLGKTITEVYKLKTAWKNTKDENGKFVLDKNGDKVKQMYMELKPTTVSYDNNITKQQTDNYRKLNDLLNKIYDNKKKIIQLDEKSKKGDYANLLESQVIDYEKKYNNIYSSVIKISEEEETSAVNQKQLNELLNRREQLEKNILQVITKQNDETLKKTSTTNSGQRYLGDKVDLKGFAFNFDASNEELKRYSQLIAGAGAEYTKVTPKVDKFGNQIKEVSVRTKENGKFWREYTATLDKSTNSIYKVDKGLKDVNNRQLGFINQLGIAIQRTIEWTVAVGGLYAGINKIKEGISFINNLDKELVSAKMVTGIQDIDSLGRSYNKLAQELGDTTLNVAKGSLEWFRQGKTIEETTELVKASTVASKLAGIESAQATTYLTAALNGFQMSSEDAMSVVDKMVTIDNQAATSVAELSEALMHSANSANLAGVSMDKLLSWVATISSTTRKSASSIGESMKTIFARMSGITTGQLDEDGMGLNDVEKALNSVGIALRKDEKTFRDFGSVIDNVASKFSGWNDLQKSSILTALAGTRQRENLAALMSNYGKSLEYEKSTLSSNGKSWERYQDYLKSTESEINKLKASQEELFINMIKSDSIRIVISSLNDFVQTINFVATSAKDAGIQLIALGTTMFLLLKNMGNIMTFFEMLGFAMKGQAAFSAVMGASFTGLIGILGKLKVAMMTLFLTPQGLAFMALATAVGVATYTIINHINHQKKLKDETDKLTSSYKSLTEAIKENNIESIKSQSQPMGEKQTQLENIINKRKEIERQIAELEKQNKSSNSSSLPWQTPQDTQGQMYINNGDKVENLKSELRALNKEYEDLIKVLKDSGIEFDSTTGKVYAYAQAQSLIKNNEIAREIRKQAEAEYNHKQEIINLINEYQNLNNIENKNTTHKQRMGQIAEQLQGSIQGLSVARDKEGNLIIQNTDLLGKEIAILTQEGNAAQTLANVKLTAAKQEALIEVDRTKVTYTEAKKRIQIYKEEAEAMSKYIEQNANDPSANIAEAFSIMNKSNAMISEYQQAIDALDKIYSIGNSGINITPINSGGYMPKDTTSSTKDTQRDLEQAQNEANRNLLNLQSKIVEAKRKLYEEDKNNALKSLKEKEQVEVNYYQGKIKQLQDEINALQDTEEDDREKLSQLKKELVAWNKDDSIYAKERRKNLEESIKNLEKTLLIKDKQDEIKRIEDEQKTKEDLYKTEEDKVNQHYENMIKDSNLYAEANRLIMSGNQQDILNLLVNYTPQYAETGQILGKSMAESMLAEVKAGMDALTQIRTGNYNVDGGIGNSNNSSSSGSIPWDGVSHKYGERSEVVKRIQRNLGITTDGIWGNQTEQAVRDFQRKNGLAIDGIIGSETWSKLIKFDTGGQVIGDGLVYAHDKEIFLNKQDSMTFRKFIDYLPKISMPNLNNVKPMQPIQYIYNAPIIQQEVEMTNNTPFDVSNNQSNWETAVKQGLFKSGHGIPQMI